MSTNRIKRYTDRMSVYFPAEQPNEPPHAQQAPLAPAGFVVCPLHVAVAQAWQQEIYRRAYEEAVAATQIPRHIRRMFSSWN